jgi:hypothetical protein
MMIKVGEVIQDAEIGDANFNLETPTANRTPRNLSQKDKRFQAFKRANPDSQIGKTEFLASNFLFYPIGVSQAQNPPADLRHVYKDSELLKFEWKVRRENTG